MTSTDFLSGLIDSSLAGKVLSVSDSLKLLSEDIDLLNLIAASVVRKVHFGTRVRIHVLDNVKNGGCSEQCLYCAQSSVSQADIRLCDERSQEEILKGIHHAELQGAYRYCMAVSGREHGDEFFTRIANLITFSKKMHRIKLCLSAGFLSEEQAQFLKRAGLDRYNHNINTSSKHYRKICESHEYVDRITTIHNAQKAGLEVCSGVIVGMGESGEDIVEMAQALRELHIDSIPVNFLVSIPGTYVPRSSLTPSLCLRVLCLFRFLNPEAEIRMAAGREVHLRSMTPLGLYVANSLFAGGYLNSSGHSLEAAKQMIEDADFELEGIEA